MKPPGWKVFGHAVCELPQLNVTEVVEFVQLNFLDSRHRHINTVNKYVKALWFGHSPLLQIKKPRANTRLN
jgi:hypothetical protein